jgi:hypothetical protein
MKKLTLLFVIIATFSNAFAQESDLTQVQPTIMVVPYTSKGEDLREKIENDANYRIAMQVISNAFSKRGFTTKDFVNNLQNTLNDQVISDEHMSQTDLFKKAIELTPTDYYIQTEILMLPNSSGNKVRILMSAIDKFSGDKTPAEPMESQPFRTGDWGKLTQLALEDGGKLESFFSLLGNEFAKIRETGRTISVKIEVAATSSHKLDEEVGDDFDLLSDLITDWVKKNAYKNYVHTQGNSATLLYFDEVKIPLRDEEGNNYDINEFSKKLYKFLRRTGKLTESGSMTAKKEIKGTMLYYQLND